MLFLLRNIINFILQLDRSLEAEQPAQVNTASKQQSQDSDLGLSDAPTNVMLLSILPKNC